MSLFQLGDFTLASGAKSMWKIECDALDGDDWAALAVMLVAVLPGPFRRAIGVPRGGLPIADALADHIDRDSDTFLLVDDVWTTGGSMARYERDHIGGWSYTPVLMRAVVFARCPTARNVTALFTMHPSERPS